MRLLSSMPQKSRIKGRRMRRGDYDIQLEAKASFQDVPQWLNTVLREKTIIIIYIYLAFFSHCTYSTNHQHFIRFTYLFQYLEHWTLPEKIAHFWVFWATLNWWPLTLPGSSVLPSCLTIFHNQLCPHFSLQSCYLTTHRKFLPTSKPGASALLLQILSSIFSYSFLLPAGFCVIYITFSI